MSNITKFVHNSLLWNKLCQACIHRDRFQHSLTCTVRAFSGRILDSSSGRRCTTSLERRVCGGIYSTRQFHVGQAAPCSQFVSPKRDDAASGGTNHVKAESLSEKQRKHGDAENRLDVTEAFDDEDLPEGKEPTAPDPWGDALAERPVSSDEVRSHFPVSFNLTAYVNRSESLQELINLGVDLSRLERMKDVASNIVRMDYRKDMAGHVQFLHDVGVEVKDIGHFITANPRIFDVPLEDLQVRINYLESKKFSRENITRILTKAPQFIQNTTKQIDHRLGVFQRDFMLSGDEVRHVTVRMPKVILSNFKQLKDMKFSLVEQMGFSELEVRKLLLKKPKIWTINRTTLWNRFDYIHNELSFSHDAILDFPGGLLRRRFLVKQRHLFLQALDRVQYDPLKPLYISLRDLTTGSDKDFCSDVAKCSIKQFNEFLYTL